MNKSTKKFLFLIQQALQEQDYKYYEKVQGAVTKNNCAGLDLSEIVEGELIREL